MPRSRIKTYVIAILIPLAVGFLSSLLTMESMDIYSELVTPPLSPPGWLFPIVWTVLYTLMGVSSALVWENRSINPGAANCGILYYGASLIFNFLWSIFFFNFRWLLFSFIWLLILLYLILRTIVCYKKVSPIAAYLQIPYALWVAFAGYLNFTLWILNR
ncbi:MAG: tryptophan-rich sensory protein [Clostridia bacterium]|nr:tryptophan-rich sensory protein [Clostridia bacterium]